MKKKVKINNEKVKQIFQQRYECVLHPTNCEYFKNDFCLNKKNVGAK